MAPMNTIGTHFINMGWALMRGTSCDLRTPLLFERLNKATALSESRSFFGFQGVLADVGAGLAL